jgi:hypothetical protein
MKLNNLLITTAILLNITSQASDLEGMNGDESSTPQGVEGKAPDSSTRKRKAPDSSTRKRKDPDSDFPENPKKKQKPNQTRVGKTSIDLNDQQLPVPELINLLPTDKHERRILIEKISQDLISIEGCQKISLKQLIKPSPPPI